MKLRQFDLHLGFAAVGTGGEDVENELRPIQHPNTDTILETLALGRRKLVIEDYEIGIGTLHALAKLVDFAFADVKT